MKYLFRMWMYLVVMLGLQVGFGSDAVAQSMTMTLDGDVVLQPQDMDPTSYYPVRDANDNLCALLKVTVTNKLKNPLVLETGGLAVEKREERVNGEIWFWVPYQVRNLHFSCSEYKPMPPVPVRLQEGKAYRLTLRTDALVKSFTDVVENFNFLKIQVLPEDAVGAFVSVGRTQNYEVEAKYTQEGGLYTSSLPLDYGEYFYKIEHEHYETLEGRVQLVATTPKQTVTLRPAYGILKITSEPTGAVVAIDGKRVGTTPWTSAKLAKGRVSVRLQSPQYALYEETVQVLGNGQVQSHHCKLVPQFGTITCRSEMADAEIWVDQEYKGVGCWTGTLSSQAPHVLEARKSGHQSQSISFTVANGEKKTEVVGAPVPMYGTLVLSTTPADVRVSIDGETMGETPLVQRLLVGKHTVVLKKEGYEDLSFEVTVAHNQRLDEKRTLAKRQLASKQAGPVASTAADFGIEMVFVKGGTFQMGATSEQGSKYADEKPVHSVTLSDFYIGKYEVTQAQWKAVMGKNLSSFTGDDNRPVECVSWEDVQEFIKKLNQLTGKRYRLPTEAEWEYAARGGKKSQSYKYAGSNAIDEVAWYAENSSGQTHPVGQKQPNELGLYDMSGNVDEWCQDWNGSYDSSAQTNPTGPTRGSDRVLRGGDWYYSARECRVSFRGFLNPSWRDAYFGFRLVLEVSSSQENPEVDPLEVLAEGMVFVEGGTFQMGATSEQGAGAGTDEKPVHTVTLSDFYIGKYEVTQAQWKAVMGENPSYFTGEDNLPVEQVSWEDVQEFIQKLNALTGKTYRLPTGAEWEYAARGGNQSQGYKYAGSNTVGDVAWYKDNSSDKTHPVGQKQPNELGLYDMSGNVYEWCQDWYGGYPSFAQTNPTGPSSGLYRILRGGSGFDGARYCRVSMRIFNLPSSRKNAYGFRLVLLP